MDQTTAKDIADLHDGQVWESRGGIHVVLIPFDVSDKNGLTLVFGEGSVCLYPLYESFFVSEGIEPLETVCYKDGEDERVVEVVTKMWPMVDVRVNHINLLNGIKDANLGPFKLGFYAELECMLDDLTPDPSAENILRKLVGLSDGYALDTTQYTLQADYDREWVKKARAVANEARDYFKTADPCESCKLNGSNACNTCSR